MLSFAKCYSLISALTWPGRWNAAKVKISKILALPNVKIILLLQQRDEVRYSDLARLIKSRGALSNAFKELTEEKLLQRRIDQTTRPVQSFYSLTRKGKEIGQELWKIKGTIE